MADPTLNERSGGPRGALRAEACIVGAGAAGLWAGLELARAGVDVLLVEKTPRTGTKILASGGTRCNLTTTLPPDAAAALFGRRGERFLRRAFRALPPSEVRTRFAALGVPTVEAPLEKVFPASGNARHVRDALEAAYREAGGRLLLDAPVTAIAPAETQPRWTLTVGPTGARANVETDFLLLAAGGKSYPGTGTTGDGYAWLQALGLELVSTVPALAPLRSPAAWVHELTGIALQDCEARLFDGSGRALARRRRPVVFTHHGLSGPGAMDLSEPVARFAAGELASSGPPEMRLDLFPDRSREDLRAELVALSGAAGAPRLRHAFELPKRLFAALTRSAGLAHEDPRANQLSKSNRHALVETLKALAVPVDATLGYDKAEVTAGGLALGEVDPGSMRVRACPGLYVFGELLDLTGPIGGLNFQAAFATAELAAHDVRRARSEAAAQP